MSRYDDLKPIYSEWRTKSLNLYREYQRLPHWVSARVKEYLGCPDYTKSIDGKEDEGSPYVSPASAEWDENSRDFVFTMRKYQGLRDWDFYSDGRFYFGVWIILESAPNTWPKDPFCVLMSASWTGARFNVRVQKTKQDFDLDLGNLGSADGLCEHIFQSIKEELMSEPLREGERQQIGFGVARPVRTDT